MNYNDGKRMFTLIYIFLNIEQHVLMKNIIFYKVASIHAPPSHAQYLMLLILFVSLLCER